MVPKHINGKPMNSILINSITIATNIHTILFRCQGFLELLSPLLIETGSFSYLTIQIEYMQLLEYMQLYQRRINSPLQFSSFRIDVVKKSFLIVANQCFSIAKVFGIIEL